MASWAARQRASVFLSCHARWRNVRGEKDRSNCTRCQIQPRARVATMFIHRRDAFLSASLKHFIACALAVGKTIGAADATKAAGA